MAYLESKATILMADDEEEFRYAFQLGLEMSGYEVISAGNGKEVLEILSASQSESKTIDLIITDYQMPGMTGTELIENLMTIKNRPPILVISGFQDQLLVEDMVKQGCSGYLLKPFTISMLIEMIKIALDETLESSN